MKINWGTGIVIAIACFMSFILFLVIRMSTEESFDHDMVTEEYYAKEIVYQKEIDAETNTNNLSEKISSRKIKEGWEIIFPSQLDPAKIKGTLLMYRPSNEKLDVEFTLNLKSSRFIVPARYLMAGRWDIIITWEVDGTPYMYKEAIVY